MPPSETMWVCRLSESASKRNVERNLALGADLFEVIAPAARAAEQHERQIVQGREADRRPRRQRIAGRADQIGRGLDEVGVAVLR